MPTLDQVLPILAILISALSLGRTLKSDVKGDAGQLMEIIIKLEGISENVKEVKTDIKDVKSDNEKTKERLTIVEQSVKSAHRRIDGLRNEHLAEDLGGRT